MNTLASYGTARADAVLPAVLRFRGATLATMTSLQCAEASLSFLFLSNYIVSTKSLRDGASVAGGWLRPRLPSRPLRDGSLHAARVGEAQPGAGPKPHRAVPARAALS